jgi:SET domain-containing protein
MPSSRPVSRAVKKVRPSAKKGKAKAGKKAAAAEPELVPEVIAFRAQKPLIDSNHAQYRLHIRKGGIHRYGIFAGEDMPKNRKVIEYTGERINRRETRKRSEEQGSMIYLFTLDSYWTLDGAVGGSGAEYINHCCDPNIRVLVTKGHILYMTKRAIRKDEELTVDYHFSKDIERIPCYCGSPKCRGTINVK